MSRLLQRRAILPRRARVLLALLCAFGALLLVAAQQPGRAQEQPRAATEQPGESGRPGGPLRGEEGDPGGQRFGDPSRPEADLVQEGRALFLEGCSSCHGEDARGIEGRAPSLWDVGALSADFYLRTGRMPMADPEDEPRRAESPYDERQIDALIAYVDTLGDGPGIPTVEPSRGDMALGFELFTEMCAGCHQVVGQGGMTTRAWIPDLQKSEPIDVAEAVVVGPFVMPKFDGQLDEHEIDSIARYVEYTEDPEDVGGWGIGHLGPIPEGLVTWLLAGAALILTIRLIGERTTE